MTVVWVLLWMAVSANAIWILVSFAEYARNVRMPEDSLLVGRLYNPVGYILHGLVLGAVLALMMVLVSVAVSFLR